MLSENRQHSILVTIKEITEEREDFAVGATSFPSNGPLKISMVISRK